MLSHKETSCIYTYTALTASLYRFCFFSSWKTAVVYYCGFLVDYNLFLSERRWGLFRSRLRPIDNPIMTLKPHRFTIYSKILQTFNYSPTNNLNYILIGVMPKISGDQHINHKITYPYSHTNTNQSKVWTCAYRVSFKKFIFIFAIFIKDRYFILEY